ncbi:hypothetical protein E0765_07180 [Sulfuricurvum sp. IAE1]|uniref:hypothetical protein n=1 Tax=Sulfuricurvum sp. IAE1 TaxID=2546102 RepID=UPI0010522D03|nr:hypothetical protein [Sulfuricurvum sp. IAE1]TDA63610.1 hypothetical protein E0765_07180 [Sulfuricurvum sp. IAE1]
MRFIRKLKIKGLRLYRKAVRRNIVAYFGDLMYEAGVVMFTTGVIGYFFIKDDKLDDVTIFKLFLYGIIVFTIGFVLKLAK